MIARIFQESTIAKYAKSMREAPREVIFNRRLLLSTLVYAMTGMCISE